jgi:hypothetical protein
MLHGPLAPAPCASTGRIPLIVGEAQGFPRWPDTLQKNSRVWESDHVMGRARAGFRSWPFPAMAALPRLPNLPARHLPWDGLTPAEQRDLRTLRVLHGFWHDRLYH